MRTCHPVMLPLLAVALAAGCAEERVNAPQPATPAAPAGMGLGTAGHTEGGRLAGTSVIERVVPVSFRLRAGTCGLTADVYAKGEMRMTIETVTAPDGRVLEVAFHDVATGTAYAGATAYTFDYENRRQRFDYTGTRPFRARVVDQFNLRARTLTPDVPQIHTYFDDYFVANADGTRTSINYLAYGDPANCDPL